MFAQNSRANKMQFFRFSDGELNCFMFFFSSDCFKIEHAVECKKGDDAQMTSIKDRQKKTWPHLLSAHVSSLSTEIAPTESGCSHELQTQPSLTKAFVNLYVWSHAVTGRQKSPRLLRGPTWSHPDRSNERQSSAITHITLQSAENENFKKIHV